MSEENFPKNCSYDCNVENGAFQIALMDTSEGTREGNTKLVAEDRKHPKIPTAEEQHVDKHKERDKRYGIESDHHLSRYKEKKKHHHEKFTSKEESTSEDEEEENHSDRVSRKEERRKDKYHKLAAEQDSTSENQEEEKHSDRVSRKEERKKDKGRNKLSAEEDSTSEDQERDKQCDDRVSRKRGKSKENRRGRSRESGHDDVPASECKRKDKYHNKPKVAGKGRDENYGSIVSHQLPEDFAFAAENKGSVNHILILGTIGSGKYTIARNISTNPSSFPSRRSLRERSGIIQCIDDGNLFKFVLVDTGGARMPDVYGAKGPSIGSIAANIKDCFKGGISLIMVVVRYDCDTPDDFEVLANLINGLFTDEGKKHIALIHNGCEMLSEENKKQYTRHFNASGPSRKLSSLCRKGILATGFPSSEESRPEMAGVFKQITEESKRMLSCLIESCEFLQPYSEILKANNDPSRVFPETKPDCCLM